MIKIKKPINFQVDEELYSEVKAVAESKKVSMGWIVRDALKRYLSRRKR